MDSSTIGLIISGVIALILLLSVLWGVKRGLKKTLFRFVWLAVTCVILFFTINPLSNWLNSFNLSSLNLDIAGKVTKLSDIGVNLLKSAGITEEVLADSPALSNLAENLPAMILNVILFVVAFWLVKAFLWPLWAIISRSIFDKQTIIEKKAKKESKRKQQEAKKSGNIDIPAQEAIPQVITIKQNKHRGWGAVFGLVMGLLVCAVTFSPVAGLNSIFQSVYNNITVEENGKEVPYLSTVLDEETLQIINCYESSIGNKMLTYTGMNALSSSMFSNLATVEVENQKVYLTDEVNTMVKIYNNIIALQSFDAENATQQSIEKALTAMQNIFVDSEGSKILYLVGDELIPYFLDQLLEDENVEIIDGDIIDDIIIRAYRNSVDFALKEFKDEILAVVDIAYELNNSNLIAPILNEDVSGFDGIVKHIGTNVIDSETFATNIVDNLYNIDMFEGEYANLAKEGIKSLFNSLGIEYTEQEITSDNVKNGLKTILKNSVDVCKAYAKAGGLNFGDSTSTALSSAGTVLDYLKSNIFTTQNYNNLITYLQTSLTDATASLGDFSNIATSLNNVTNWSEELYCLSNFYSAIVEIVQSNITVDDIANGNTQLIENLGKGLQSAIAGESKIVNNNNIRTALEEILSTVSLGDDIEDILAIEVDSGVTLKDNILNNIYNSGMTSIVDWKTEFKYNLAVISKFYKLIQDGFDVDKLSQPENTQLEYCGLAIDDALKNTKLVLSHKVLKAVIKDLINNKVELPAEVEDMLSIKDSNGITVLDNMLNNIYKNGTNGNIEFKTELKTIVNAVSEISKLDISQVDSDNIKEIGAVLDGLTNSQIFNSHVLATIIGGYTDEMLTSLDADIKTKLQPFIDGIKANLENVDSFEIELGYLIDLLNVVDDEELVLSTIGQKIDEILMTSKLVEKDNITLLMESLFDDFVSITDENLKTAVNGIKDNISEIENYESEFVHLDNLINSLDKTLPEIGVEIDKVLNESNPSKLITKNNVTKIIESLIGDFITHSDESLNTALTKVKDSILAKDAVTQKNNIDEIRNYTKEFNNVDTLINTLDGTLQEIGGKIDDILASDSKLLTKEEFTIIIEHFFDEEIDKLNLDAVNDKGLIDIIAEIRNNIKDIEDYSDEFVNLETLTSSLNSENLTEIGQKLDDIKASNSDLITQENVESIVQYFFEEESSEYKDGKFSSVITAMQTKLENTSSYQNSFAELNIVVDYMGKYVNVSTTEDFKSATDLGLDLDTMANMQYACDKDITKSLARIMFDTLNTALESEVGGNLLKNDVENVLNGEEYNFDNYLTSSYDYSTSHADKDYYTNLISDIKDALN